MLANKESHFLSNAFNKLNSGVNLLVIAVSVVFIAILVMIIILVKCRSKRIKKKNSMSEEEGGYTVDSGILKPNVLNIKRTLSEISDSSDDVLYEKDRRFVVDRVQPKRCSLRSQKSVSSVDSTPDAVPTLVISLVTEEDSATVTLIKAKNLRRSGFSASDQLIPEGVFARIYPKTKRSLSTDSSQTDGEQQTSRGINYFETSFVKSKKSKFIKFDENETFRMSADSFPVRISIYEMDKQKIRYNIGHSFLAINTLDNYQTNQIIELDLHSTVFKAKHSLNN